MKLFKDISVNNRMYRVGDSFKKYGLVVQDGFQFSNINIVIGPNGSGKTRLLNAIKEIYKNNKIKVVYGYFPNLSFLKKTPQNSHLDELPDATLYEALLNNTIEFSDFIIEIEKQGVEYLNQLLVWHSKLQQTQNKNAFKIFKDFFEATSGYTVEEDKTEIYLSVGNEKEVLSDAFLKFSPGQIMMLYLSIFFSFQNTVSNNVLIIDEPECHLHTSVLVQFLKQLKEKKFFAEIWIATHSVFAIPEFEFEDLVYINNGTVIEKIVVYIKKSCKV